MKGVVRPHAMPTRRKPRVQRIMEGEGSDGGGVAVGEGEGRAGERVVGVDIVERCGRW